MARTTGDHNGNGFQDIGGHDDASADTLRWFGGSGVVLRSGTVSDTVRAVGDWSEAEMRTSTNFASGSTVRHETLGSSRAEPYRSRNNGSVSEWQKWLATSRCSRSVAAAPDAIFAADRSSRKLIDRLARVDLLVIDEMGYLNLRPEQTNIFFKLMEERYRRRATIITTNLEYDEWHNFLGNKALVDALLSRLRHQCHTVRIDGPSLREPQG